ncbi:MAG: H-type lectin domain-containing protein [Paracoccaceae bacterium]|nr:H-type lectin domain-containing protein [Paracoccaceae bacterium]
MKRLSSHLVGIDQGSEILFSDFETGGVMWTGSDYRECRVPVKFSEKYDQMPTVQVSIAMFDIGHTSNQRADITAENITESGFEIVFRTWSDTKIARIRANWMSIGALAHVDDWNLY